MKPSLKRLGELEGKATKAPWFVVGPPWGEGDWVNAGNEDPHVGRFVADCLCPSEDQDESDTNDAAFIAESRNALPTLLRIAEAAKGYLHTWSDADEDALRAALAEIDP